MISREILTNMFNNLNYEQQDKLLDLIEYGQNKDGYIFQYHNETALIYDTYNDNFISWYKLTHIGRSIQTNITDIRTLDLLFEELKGIL